MDEAIARVRSFNRLLVERVGALEDRYLARERPLGEARLLWEIGDGSEVRTLRARLGLDSGYLSRMLRSLERDGLVEVVQEGDDGRVRFARLTEAGCTERRELERQSDALARSYLAPLNESRRERLVTAMAEVERLLTAGLVDLELVDPESPAAVGSLERYFAEIDTRFESGFDPAHSVTRPEEFRPPQGIFLVAALRDAPIGCVGLRFPEPGVAEVKRMWVAPEARGLGLGRRLLSELESRARQAGARTLRLETNRALTEAIELYRSSGFVEVDRFNDEGHADYWFAKALPA